MLAHIEPFAAIETPRVRLRCVRPEDAAAIARMMTTPVSRRLASWPVPYTVDMAARRIEEARSAAWNRRLLPLVLDRRGDGALLGWISVAPASPSEPRLGMLTYWLGEAFHGQGLMREAAPLAIAAAFRELGLETIRAAVQPDNAASLAVIKRLGAALLGAGRIHVPARERDEECLYWELPRPKTLPARAMGPAAALDLA